MSHGPSDPTLLAPLQQLEGVESEVERLLTSCSTEAFQRQPEPGHWSPAQCVEHLVRTTELYLAKVDPVLERARRKGISGRGEGIGWLEKKFIQALEPPPRRRFKAPKIFRPSEPGPETAEPEEALKRFRESQAALIERIERADGLAISRLKIFSPVSPLLRFRLAAVFAILATHQRRHLWQLRRILALGETMY